MSAGTGIIKASKSGPRSAEDTKMNGSAIACRAAKLQRMPQTKGVTRLIELETDALVATVSKEFADSSAVMDGSFGRIGAGECAGRACRGVG